MVQPIDTITAIDALGGSGAGTASSELDISGFGSHTAITVDGANDVLVFEDVTDGTHYKISFDDLSTELGVSTASSGLVFSGAAFGGASSQVVPNNTWTDFLGSATTVELYDTDGYHDNTTNRQRLTVPADVNYVKVGFRASWADNTTGSRRARIIHYNSASTIQAYVGYDTRGLSGTAGSAYFTCESRPVVVSANHYFVCQIYQNSGGNLSLYAYEPSQVVQPEQFGWAYIEKVG